MSSLPLAGEVRRLPVPHLLARPVQFDMALAELTRRFAAGAEAHDRTASFPFENFSELQRLGLIAAVLPETEGGGGATLADARRIVSAVARGEPSTALVLTMTYLTHRSLARADSRWSPRLRHEVYRSAVEEGALANSLRVEPALGSPARGGAPQTVARRVGEGWQLSGHKVYSTGIPALRWLIVWARTDEPEPRVGAFLVPRESPGIRVIESWDHLGLRASGSHEVMFDAVELPLDHAVDVRSPEGWTEGPDSDQYAWMIVLLGSLYDGIARAARDWVLGFLSERAPGSLGAPLSTLPRVQQTVGEIEALLWANDALLSGLVQATDAGKAPSAADSGLIKYNVTGNAIRVLDLTLQLSGNHGLSRRNPLERHHRDVLCSRIHTPQNDSILIGAGKQAFERSVPGTFDSFIQAFERLLEDQPSEAVIRERGARLLAELVKRDDWLPDAFARPDPHRYRQLPLHRDAAGRFSVVSFVWGPGQATPIHDHTVWGLIGMLRGAEYSQGYRFTGPKQLVPAGPSVRLEPGQVEAVSPAIGDIHRVHNAYDDRVSISIHVYGADIGAVSRSIYQADGSSQPFVSGYSPID